MKIKTVLKFPRPEQGSVRTWTIAGTTLLSEVSDLLNIEFQPRGRYKTIAGFIMTELGYVPNEGDQLKMFGYTFTVKTRHYLRIVDVHIARNLKIDADD
jgi:CBS domain containing-hemolysin-like protein